MLAEVAAARSGDILAPSPTALSSPPRARSTPSAKLARGGIDIGRNGQQLRGRPGCGRGIRPFTIGADVHGYTIRRPQDVAWAAGYFDESGRANDGDAATMLGGPVVFSLAQVMNELLALGFPLTEVIAMATSHAAVAFGLDDLGSLAPGRVADVTVIAREPGRWRATDCLGATIELSERLCPELCLRAGVAHRADSSLLAESTADVA